MGSSIMKITEEVKSMPNVEGCVVFDRKGNIVSNCLSFSHDSLIRYGKSLSEMFESMGFDIKGIMYTYRDRKLIITPFRKGIIVLLGNLNVALTTMHFVENISKNLEQFIDEDTKSYETAQGIDTGLINYIMDNGSKELAKYFGSELAEVAMKKARENLSNISGNLTVSEMKERLFPVLFERFSDIMDKDELKVWIDKIIKQYNKE